MTTEVAPWNDEGSEVSDVESWSEADPAMLLETLIASDDENNTSNEDFPNLKFDSPTLRALRQYHVCELETACEHCHPIYSAICWI